MKTTEIIKISVKPSTLVALIMDLSEAASMYNDAATLNLAEKMLDTLMDLVGREEALRMLRDARGIHND